MTPRALRPVAALLTVLLCERTARLARATPVVEPTASLAIDASYDSNVFNGRGPDEVTRVAPGVALHVRDLRTDLQLTYELGLWVYAFGTAKNSVNHRGTAVLEERLTRRLNLHLADEIVYAGDPGFLLRAGVVAPQTSIFDNILDGALTYALARRVEGSVAYSYRHTSFGEPPAGSPPLYDGDEHDALASVEWRADRFDVLRLVDRLQYFTAAGDGLALAHSPSVGWLRRFARPVDLRVEGGPVFYTLLSSARDLPVENLGSGVTYRLTAVLRFYTPTLRATLSYVRDLVGGTGAASVLWADYGQARISYHKERLFDLGLAVGFYENGDAPDSRRLYDGVGVDANVDVILRPGLHLGAYYAFRWQDAVVHDAAALPAITRHIVGVRLVAVFGGWPRPQKEVLP